MRLSEYIVEGFDGKDLVSEIQYYIDRYNRFIENNIVQYTNKVSRSTKSQDAAQTYKDVVDSYNIVIGFSNASRPKRKDIDIKKVDWSKPSFAVILCGNERWVQEIKLDPEADAKKNAEYVADAIQLCKERWEEWMQDDRDEFISDYKS